MKTLMCNALITRRQEMCFIQDEDGVLLWSGRKVHAAFSFLIEQGHEPFLLVDGIDANPIQITARRVSEPPRH